MESFVGVQLPEDLADWIEAEALWNNVTPAELFKRYIAQLQREARTLGITLEKLLERYRSG